MTSSPNVPFETKKKKKKKKKGHEVAYLVILLVILLGTFLFAMVVVNSFLGSIPFPR